MSGTRPILDSYLTGKARRGWPRAQVWIVDDHYVLRRPDADDVQLGVRTATEEGFGDASRALSYLVRDATEERT